MEKVQPAVDAASASAAASDGDAAAGDASIAALVRQTADYARAFGNLAASEAALARINLIRLLGVALLVPALALGVLIGIDALVAAVAFDLIRDWSLAIVCMLLLNLGLLLAAFVLLRRWWRTLSLPRSRAALAQFVQSVR